MSNLALCISLSGDCTDVSILSATNSVAGLTPEITGKTISVMVIGTNLEVNKLKNDCLVHYMFILPKFQRKSYGRYFMSKVFKFDAELDSRIYAVKRLMHECTPCSYKEPESEYSYSALYNQIEQDMLDTKEGKLRKPKCCKYIN